MSAGLPSDAVSAELPSRIEREAARALRFWAVVDSVYAVALVLLVALAVPWKTPALNLAVITWAATLIGAAPFLWRATRWAYRMALVTSLVGIAAAFVTVAAMVASWAFLRAAYGAFGAGASLASLLLAAVALQILGLYSLLRLRTLLRWDVRLFMKGSARVPARALALLALLPVLAGGAVHARFSMTPMPAAVENLRVAAMAHLRAALEGREAVMSAALAGVPLGPGPLVVSAWLDGSLITRVEGTGTTLAAAVEAAARRLVTMRNDKPGTADQTARWRLKIDRIVGRAPLLEKPAIALALGLAPGLDGIVDAVGKIVLLPDDVLASAAAGASAPMPALAELRVGIDLHFVERRLTATSARRPLSRVRIESWIETEGGVADVARGNVLPAPLPSPMAAAIAAGDYMLRQAETDGRFRYRYQPYADAALTGEPYSLARHAGCAYGLALLYAHTGESRFREGAAAALGWMAQQIPPTCGAGSDRRCLVEGGRATFGASALTAIAMLEYQRRTGDRRFAALAFDLVRFLTDRQRPDGEFHHHFDVGRGAEVPGPPRMFASEQAALALVLADRMAAAGPWRLAAERALDFLTRRKYDFPLGRFIYGADHWTCIAAEEAWPALRHRHYLDFCRGYAGFMRRLQYAGGPAEVRDFGGHYGFGYQLLPQAPATAGFAEALLSTLALARHHGVDDEALRDDTRRALGAIAREQLHAGNDYLVRRRDHARGGIRRSLVEPEIRIDFVQHAAAALVRAPALGLDRL